MAGDETVLGSGFEPGLPPAAHINGVRAARSEVTGFLGHPGVDVRAASRSRVPTSLHVGVGQRSGPEQGVGVGMGGMLIDRGCLAVLHDAASVEHQDAMRNVAHHGKIVRDEQVAEPEGALQASEQVQHLGLRREVQRAHRLVTDNKSRRDHQRSGDGYPLALATRELSRVVIGGIAGETDAPEHGCHPFCGLGLAGRTMGPEGLR